MLNAIIRFSLRYRLLVVAVAMVTLIYGSYVLWHLPIDVFPDLNRPRVTILTEAPGMAPEEVETLITVPLESVLHGATGVQAVRSSSHVGLSVIYVEFDWGTDIYKDRQIVAEKIALAAPRLPEGIYPQLAPISSIMGQIAIIGMVSESDQTSPIELRSLADWVVRQRLLAIPGVAQVVTMGGGRLQFQVLVNPELLVKYDVTLADVERALARSNHNSPGGYLSTGDYELLVRSVGRIQQLADLEKVVVKPDPERPVLLREVARVVEGTQTKRGDAALGGKPAVMLTVTKQPGADTRELTDQMMSVIEDLRPVMPRDVRLEPTVYQQKTFIDLSIHNVVLALRDGALLVVIVLFVFLVNFRTTFITLTAIPLSIVSAGLVFKWFGMSINTMTLGGLAVAIGELVDDAIVDVENIFRRLRQNRHLPNPKPALRVVYEASSEVRNSIVFSTILVVLVFVPLLALGGMEGRLFTPLAIAYIVSILASLVVSLTVTPVLSYWLLPNARFMERRQDSVLLQFLKWLGGLAIRFSIQHSWPILAAVLVAVLASVVAVTRIGRDFLPPFNEGSVQVNVLVPPGTSLETSSRIGALADKRLMAIPGIATVGRRTGRAELDEHIMGVNVNETIVTVDPKSARSREAILADIRRELDQVPGAVIAAEQPLQHLISHMLSGVMAQIGIKIYGDDLSVLRSKAREIESAIRDVPGVIDLLVEQQVDIPQLQIVPRREVLARLGITVADINELLETAMNGRTVSQVLEGQRTFDLVVRLDEPYRGDLEYLKRLVIHLPTEPSPSNQGEDRTHGPTTLTGGGVPLASVADIITSSGPNTINRENVRRRIVVQCNTAGRDLGSIVNDIELRLAPIRASLPPGYFIDLGGQFESQQSATRMIGLLSIVALVGMFLALYTLFGSVNLSLQVLAALPMAAIGAISALLITGQSLTVASLVGFISLAGIASRNGILLIAHYLHLVRHEGEQFTPQMIERAGKERLAPMLMTALAAAIALVPFALAAGQPGKEILYPVATVIIGGLISSTLLDFFVHPALFWRFGRQQAQQLQLRNEEAALADNL